MYVHCNKLVTYILYTRRNYAHTADRNLGGRPIIILLSPSRLVIIIIIIIINSVVVGARRCTRGYYSIYIYIIIYKLSTYAARRVAHGRVCYYYYYYSFSQARERGRRDRILRWRGMTPRE